MTHPLQTTIDRLPELLERNAPAMMRRIVARMKAEAALSGQSSHGGLFLKVAEEDLVREFTAGVRNAFAPGEAGAFDIAGSLSLDSNYGAIDEFETSSDAFRALRDTATRLGVKGVGNYGKSPFVTAMKEAFKQSRMDAKATEELMPSAKSALNDELKALYTQLDRLGSTQ